MPANPEGITTLEHVEIWVDIQTPRRGYVIIDIECPSGTPSNLLGNRRDSASSHIRWKMSTVRCWGEKPEGRFVFSRTRADVVRGHVL